MASRSRSRYNDPCQQGTRKTKHKTLGTELVHTDNTILSNHYVYEVCADTTMPRPYTIDHGLSIEKTVVRPTTVNGQYDHGPTSAWEPERYMSYRLHPYSANVMLRAFTTFSPDYYKTLALANASPYKSEVNLPLFISELRELPEMLRQLGRILAKRIRATDVAGGYLAYSFGWAPLVSDLMKLFDLTKAIEDRKAYFRRLERGTRVRRSLGTREVRVAQDLNTSVTTMVNNKTALQLVGTLTESQKIWYTLNAKLRSPLRMSPSDLHSLSRNQVLGLRVNPADIWDAIPWSWLIDYFINIGDVLEATRAIVGLDVTRINIMCQSKIVIQYEAKNVLPGLIVQPGFVYRTKKARYPYSNAVPALTSTPFFTDHMAGILGSLVTVRALKARGVK